MQLRGIVRPVVPLSAGLYRGGGGGGGGVTVQRMDDSVIQLVITQVQTAQGAELEVLERLSFNGAQAVLTDIYMTDKMRLEASLQADVLGTTHFAFGARSASASDGDNFALAYGGSVTYPMFAASRSSIAGTISTGAEYAVSLGPDGYYLNGELLKSYGSEPPSGYTPAPSPYDGAPFTGAFPLCIGGLNHSGSVDSRRWEGHIGVVSIFTNTGLLYRLLPVRRISDRAEGFFDIVQRKFYIREG